MNYDERCDTISPVSPTLDMVGDSSRELWVLTECPNRGDHWIASFRKDLTPTAAVAAAFGISGQSHRFTLTRRPALDSRLTTRWIRISATFWGARILCYRTAQQSRSVLRLVIQGVLRCERGHALTTHSISSQAVTHGPVRWATRPVSAFVCSFLRIRSRPGILERSLIPFRGRSSAMK